jgi:hypothetical protein
MKPFLNSRRLRDYPRLFFFTTWTLLLLNVVFHRGWLGAVGQLIGTDFIMLYSGGRLARQDPAQLYNFERQAELQQALVEPTPLWGLLPHNYPPYVAFAIQPLTFIPLAWALALWSLMTLLLAVVAARLMHQHLTPDRLKNNGLSQTQLIIVLLSFFPFVEGFLVGQNHGLTLLLVVGILVSMQKNHWALAGACAGLTIYKPQFALGFLILWLVWRKWRALAAYAITALTWMGSAALAFGIDPYRAYLAKMDVFLQMLYLEGFGTYLEVTPYGLLVSILPASAWEAVLVGTQILTLSLVAGLAYTGWKLRFAEPEERLPAVILATLFPFLAAPHTLLHDLVILAPALLLWARWHPWDGLLKISAGIYLATFLLPWAAEATGIPFLALIPLCLVVLLVKQMLERRFYSKHIFPVREDPAI